MSGFLLRVLLFASLLIMLIMHLPAFFVDTFGALLLASTALALFNGALRRVFAARNWKLTWVKLSAASFIVNLSLWTLLMRLLPGFRIDDWLQAGSAFLALGVCSAALNKMFQDR